MTYKYIMYCCFRIMYKMQRSLRFLSCFLWTEYLSQTMFCCLGHRKLLMSYNTTILGRVRSLMLLPARSAYSYCYLPGQPTHAATCQVSLLMLLPTRSAYSYCYLPGHLTHTATFLVSSLIL